METERRLVVMAIALERYRQRRGKYPDRPADLTPELLPHVLQDPMDGQPLRYRPATDGGFLLYAVGDDGKDDGGDASSPTGSLIEWYRNQDVVWPARAEPALVADYKEKAIAEMRRRAARTARSTGRGVRSNGIPPMPAVTRPNGTN